MDSKQFSAKRKSVDTAAGRISYVEHGTGPVALLVHGVQRGAARALERVDRRPRARTGELMGVRLVGDRMASPLGSLLLVCDAEGRVRALDFADHEIRMHRLLQRHCGADGYTLADGPAPRAVVRALDAYFAGRLHAVDGLDVHTGGTDFQRRVWADLRAVAAGTTTTYGRLAKSLCQPTASRAVGLANGANPVAIIVPCHRVIGANGALTGYGGGIERKRWLLDHERRWAGAVWRTSA